MAKAVWERVEARSWGEVQTRNVNPAMGAESPLQVVPGGRGSGLKAWLPLYPFLS